MKIQPYNFTIKLPGGVERSAGLNLSDVVRSIGFEMGYIPPQYQGEDISASPERAALGMAWEDWVFRTQHPEVSHQPGEVFGGNIACSADGISWFGNDLKVHECKLTWKSMKRESELQNEWLWLSQTMGYCLQWGTNLARYHIYWVNGDYQRGQNTGGPQYKLYDLEFTKRELEDNWLQIHNRAKMLGR